MQAEVGFVGRHVDHMFLAVWCRCRNLGLLHVPHPSLVRFLLRRRLQIRTIPGDALLELLHLSRQAVFSQRVCDLILRDPVVENGLGVEDVFSGGLTSLDVRIFDECLVV